MKPPAWWPPSGADVTKFQPGDRVIVFHHIPCWNVSIASDKLYAQCPVYKKVGVTAGFEPAGGGFAQYVRVMDWIVERGVEKIPDGVSFDRACFVEPREYLPERRRAVRSAARTTWSSILGQGPIGLIFTMLVKRTGARDGRHRHDAESPRAGAALAAPSAPAIRAIADVARSDQAT